jgi:outer membrane receptor protein involved in Fe transport
MTLRALLATASFTAASAAMAQTTPPPPQQPTTPVQEALQEEAEAQAQDPTLVQPEEVQDIVVVGTNIRGADVTDILPVTVLTTEDIEATAATSGDELFRSIPQAGDVAFNEGRDTGGINDARGDVASINLRALGTGNTLVLLNGRRMVLHPGTQAENLVPVQSVNTNAIPVTGIRRIEVLRDGASAIYGTDAVAGVINTVLKTRFNGVTVELEGTQTDHADQMEFDLSFEAGHTFNGGRTNISLFGSYTDRDPLFARERRNSRSSDLRPLLVGTAFQDDTDFDNRSTDSIFGEFTRLNANFTPASGTASIIRYNNIALTSATNPAFHVQPDTNPGCIAPAGPGICYDNATLATTGEDRNLRYDTNTERTIQSDLQRLNLFGFINHDFSDTLSFFGEVGYYKADTASIREQETSLANQRLIVPANNPYNPIGSGPGRLPLLTGVPAAGAAVELGDYRPVDVGPLTYQVANESYRLLGGLRGEIAGFDWEAAALHSTAKSNDTMQTISATLFQQALSRTDASAYNPFNGGSPTDPSRFDTTPNPTSVTAPLLVDVFRINETSLTMADLRVSRNDLFRLPGGDVGFAMGLEYRHETYEDDRDPRLDGTIAFVALDGSTNGSDVLGASPTPDSRGSRDVLSGFAELAVPIVSEEMKVPLIHSLTLQVAGRYEDYTSFGSVAKPRVALSYYPISWLQFRGSWSQGFRAPGLPQLFENGIQRSNTRTDYIRCEADLRAGRIANFELCGRTFGIVSNRSGSQSLRPEESDNFTVGLTLQPPLPRRLGRLTATFDYWEIRQTNLIGLFGDANALTLDYLLRLTGGSNPNVQRAAPTAQEIADFAGTGLTPVGRVIQVIDNYQNLSPRSVRGFDIGVYYSIDDTGIGDFDVRLNAARLLEFFQQPGELQSTLLAAQEAGTLHPSINITGAEDLIRENGRPKWRASATVTWRLGGFGAGYFANYVSDVLDTGATLTDGTPFRVEDHITHNLYVQYTWDQPGPLNNFRLRAGIRNMFDSDPPLADATFGYLGELHSIRGRSFYLSVRKRF